MLELSEFSRLLGSDNHFFKIFFRKALPNNALKLQQQNSIFLSTCKDSHVDNMLLVVLLNFNDKLFEKMKITKFQNRLREH